MSEQMNEPCLFHLGRYQEAIAELDVAWCQDRCTGRTVDIGVPSPNLPDLPPTYPTLLCALEYVLNQHPQTLKLLTKLVRGGPSRTKAGEEEKKLEFLFYRPPQIRASSDRGLYPSGPHL